MRRLALLPLLFAIVLLAGCGGEDAAPTAAVAQAAPKAKKVRVVPKKAFVRRVERICDDHASLLSIRPPAQSAGAVRAWSARHRGSLRSADRRMTRLGVPSRDRERWRRAKAKLHALVGHMDTLGAAAAAGSGSMLRLSAAQYDRTAASATRRFARFGADGCA